ncbi:Hypothetical protein SRAE_1000087400 [Strongyloides ratti]|uniref:Uncharacterized protein n=1 Tax=Strongyloides ratti TaxID=34506 RepID=A0A090L535_STRRB|nr:Hypothetical protein SRAE_1000087400 [Strongyloides ratti]CEF62604.1 Hypothetical protein SRAE_1000087400 [Strongyloides ratti]
MPFNILSFFISLLNINVYIILLILAFVPNCTKNNLGGNSKIQRNSFNKKQNESFETLSKRKKKKKKNKRSSNCGSHHSSSSKPPENNFFIIQTPLPTKAKTFDEVSIDSTSLYDPTSQTNCNNNFISKSKKMKMLAEAQKICNIVKPEIVDNLQLSKKKITVVNIEKGKEVDKIQRNSKVPQVKPTLNTTPAPITLMQEKKVEISISKDENNASEINLAVGDIKAKAMSDKSKDTITDGKEKEKVEISKQELDKKSHREQEFSQKNDIMLPENEKYEELGNVLDSKIFKLEKSLNVKADDQKQSECEKNQTSLGEKK